MLASLSRLSIIALATFFSLCSDVNAAGTDDWITVNKDYSSHRYVDLDQITPSNVGRLKEICEIQLDEPSWFSSGILKVGRTLYVTTRRMTYAIDAATCHLRWRYVIKESGIATPNNRGAAYLDGKIFRGTADGHLIALDAATGKVVWDVDDADTKTDLSGNGSFPLLNESFVAAPVAWNGKVFIGLATADYGIQGRMMAFDAKSGKELWRTYTVPKGMMGGAFWTSFSLDPSTGEVFLPVSNPFPDYTSYLRPGPNLLTNSIVSLNTKTGKFNWFYQAVPHDLHDWDLGTPPTLYRTPSGKEMLTIGGKDG
ncbi:MAG: PQQ-binding-like beta-propeller repeat protein [Stellaceae bacterium]